MARGRLKYRIAVPATVAVVVLLVVCIFCGWAMQKQQAEEQMRANAHVLAEEMAAVWDFISECQDRINYDADGSFNFKGLHCSIAGLSVGALFTSRTDYEISYASAAPRNPQNIADDLEAEAIAAFSADETATEFYRFVERDGEPYFRYIAPLRVDRACLECHGEPAGELDVTGNPKEGMAIGDLVGVTNISIPTRQYESDLAQSVGLQVVFLLLLAVGSILVIRYSVVRNVTRPLERVEGAIAAAGTGSLCGPVDAQDIGAKDELADLVAYLNKTTEQLEGLYQGLEGQVAERTGQLARVNEQLARANEELTAQARTLKSLNERLSEDNLYKSHYFTMMSHELKTPLAAITAYANMLESLRQAPDPAVRDVECARIVGEIRSHAASLMQLIANILESARLEAGEVPLRLGAVDMVDVFAVLDKTLSPLAAERGVTLHYCAAREVPVFLADLEKLQHILENLAANALRHSSLGQAVVLDAYYRRRDDVILLRVMDEGPGIPADEQALVFEKFVQSKSSIASPVRGTGLGLALAREYTELHGGRIDLRSTEGEGCTFTVVLPYRPVVCDEEEEE